jgi:hypothetical protein
MNFVKFIRNIISVNLTFSPTIHHPTEDEKVPQVETLGSLINAKRRVDEAAKANEKRLQQLAKDQQTAKDEIEVKRFLEAVKVSFTHDIKAGRDPVSVLIPEGAPFNTKGWHFDTQLHKIGYLYFPHKTLYDDFFKWVAENKLYVGIGRQHFDDNVSSKRVGERYEVFCWGAKPDA